jgi:hypothetical protein
MTVDHYYVQDLSDQVFLIRECLSEGGKQGPNDRIVHSFNMRYDAYNYVKSINEEHRKLAEEVKSEK